MPADPRAVDRGAPGAAGLPPLPRTAWLEIDLDGPAREPRDGPRGWPAPGVRVEPVVKADAYGHGAVPVARALEAAGADGLCVATLDEALELRDGRHRAADPRPVPDPAGLGADGRSPRDRGERRRRDAARPRCSAGLGSAGDRRTRRSRSQLEVETGLGRGGFAPEAASTAAGPSGRAAAASAGRPLVAPAGAGGRRAHRAARTARFEARRGRAARRPGSPCRPRHLAASGGLLAAVDGRRLDGVRPGSRCTAWCPTR